jgi:hypothetical protein
VYLVDHTATIRVEGGTSVRLVVADPDCHQIGNCAQDPVLTGPCTPASLDELDPTIAARIGAQPYAGQFLGLRVTAVKVVE